jgi:hypothetical protein
MAGEGDLPLEGVGVTPRDELAAPALAPAPQSAASLRGPSPSLVAGAGAGGGRSALEGDEGVCEEWADWPPVVRELGRRGLLAAMPSSSSSHEEGCLMEPTPAP